MTSWASAQYIRGILERKDHGFGWRSSKEQITPAFPSASGQYVIQPGPPRRISPSTAYPLIGRPWLHCSCCDIAAATMLRFYFETRPSIWEQLHRCRHVVEAVLCEATADQDSRLVVSAPRHRDASLGVSRLYRFRCNESRKLPSGQTLGVLDSSHGPILSDRSLHGRA
jgi:hypothetical protein